MTITVTKQSPLCPASAISKQMALTWSHERHRMKISGPVEQPQYNYVSKQLVRTSLATEKFDNDFFMPA